MNGAAPRGATAALSRDVHSCGAFDATTQREQTPKLCFASATLRTDQRTWQKVPAKKVPRKTTRRRRCFSIVLIDKNLPGCAAHLRSKGRSGQPSFALELPPAVYRKLVRDRKKKKQRAEVRHVSSLTPPQPAHTNYA